MIRVNQKQIKFKEGMTVEEALNIAGESVDNMVLVMINERVLSFNELNSETVIEGAHIKVLTIISGG